MPWFDTHSHITWWDIHQQVILFTQVKFNRYLNNELHVMILILVFYCFHALIFVVFVGGGALPLYYFQFLRVNCKCFCFTGTLWRLLAKIGQAVFKGTKMKWTMNDHSDLVGFEPFIVEMWRWPPTSYLIAIMSKRRKDTLNFSLQNKSYY